VIQTWRSLGNKSALKQQTLRIAALVEEIVSDLRSATAGVHIEHHRTHRGDATTVFADKTISGGLSRT